MQIRSRASGVINGLISDVSCQISIIKIILLVFKSVRIIYAIRRMMYCAMISNCGNIYHHYYSRIDKMKPCAYRKYS